MKLFAAVCVLTLVNAALAIVGGVLTLRFAAETAYLPMVVQFAGFLVALAGASYGGYWMRTIWRDKHGKA